MTRPSGGAHPIRAVLPQDYRRFGGRISPETASDRPFGVIGFSWHVSAASSPGTKPISGVQRGYAQLRAPFAGVVTAKSVEPGNLATPGAPLLTIEREGAFRLEVPVEESRLPLIRSGSKVTVMLDALGRTIEAKIGEVVPSVDAASRAYLVKIDLPARPQLRSGIFGRARFVVGTRPVLSVPASAVMERGQVQSVFVVENGAARLRLITIGRKMADRAEVLSGLNAGDQALSPIPVGLTDGAKVEIRQ